MQADEAELVARSLRHDTAAYAELVERYKNAILHHCFAITHDESLAEDVAQETFITAYYKLHTFDTSRRLSTWLFKIATNKALRAIKHDHRTLSSTPSSSARSAHRTLAPMYRRSMPRFAVPSPGSSPTTAP